MVTKITVIQIFFVFYNYLQYHLLLHYARYVREIEHMYNEIVLTWIGVSVFGDIYA